MRTLLVTGGAGFIGSNFVRYYLARYPDCRIVVLDKLTYAGRLENLADVLSDPRLEFVQGDICDPLVVEPLVARADAVVNFAAETHVDRAVMEAGVFVQTNVYGVYVLLEAARKYRVQRFLQVSTDEVYGSVEVGYASEEAPLAPRNPYAASKAGADLLARSYFITHGVPVLITRGGNNFGPYQYPEKFIPLAITNALEDLPIPIYGDGRNVRDRLYVLDHCAAIDLVLEKGTPGEVYNIFAGHEYTNLAVARLILDLLGKPHDLIRFVKDRPGHDRRYALDTAKVRALGWQPRYRFEEALATTVEWYRTHQEWWRTIKRGEFAHYYQRNYGWR